MNLDFRWHELGLYDVPASIDYVLRTTGKNKLNYVGHSMGTTSFFVMASMRPDYNQKINQMIALAPVAYMSHTRSPIHIIARHSRNVQVKLHTGSSIVTANFISWICIYPACVITITYLNCYKRDQNVCVYIY